MVVIFVSFKGVRGLEFFIFEYCCVKVIVSFVRCIC